MLTNSSFTYAVRLVQLPYEENKIATGRDLENVMVCVIAKGKTKLKQPAIHNDECCGVGVENCLLHFAAKRDVLAENKKKL